MKKLLTFAVVAALVWFGYTRTQTNPAAGSAAEPTVEAPALALQPQAQPPSPPTQQFACDGRTHCSQMSSCEEARYFIRHCPDTKMDGDGDGVPCESQWCK